MIKIIRTAYLYDKDYHLLRYEDFIDGNISKLEEYLGCSLNASVDDVGPYGRVSRTKNYGNWRKWFKPSDVEFFKPLFSPYMDYFGYHYDWELDDTKVEPCNGSEYFMKLYKER